MIKVYGCSDDLVEVDGADYPYDEIGCYDMDVILWFDDGTTIKIGYPKKDVAVWWIKVLKQGTGEQTLTICEDEDANIYSDIFEIDANLVLVQKRKKEET